MTKRRSTFSLVDLIRQWIEAVRHVRSGGRTTRAAATRRATAPPKRCPSCHQPTPHSPDWRDHLDH